MFKSSALQDLIKKLLVIDRTKRIGNLKVLFSCQIRDTFLYHFVCFSCPSSSMPIDDTQILSGGTEFRAVQAKPDKTYMTYQPDLPS